MALELSHAKEASDASGKTLATKQAGAAAAPSPQWSHRCTATPVCNPVVIAHHA